jgi:phosphomevalonate kinase
MAVNRYAQVSFIRKDGPDFILQSPTFLKRDLSFQISVEGDILFLPGTEVESIGKLNFFIKSLEYLAKRKKMREKIPPMRITLDTREFFLAEKNQKLGLGSSAALTVALLQGLLAQLNPNDTKITDPPKLFRLAEEIHYTVQGKRGSGIDIAASCFGGIIQFRRMNSLDKPSFQIQSLALPESLIILPVWTGKSASTTNLVNQVNKFQKRNLNRYKNIIQQLSKISHLACQAFSNKEIQIYLNYCSEYYQRLKQLGEASQTNIISKVHQQIWTIANAAGAVYKPSGAGGGDIGLVLTDSQNIAQSVSDNLLRSGFEILNLSPSIRGSEVELSDFSN